MTLDEAYQYGRRKRQWAEDAYEAGDVNSVALDVEWHIAEHSYRLGIIDRYGVIQTTSEVANAFRRGWKRGTRA